MDKLADRLTDGKDNQETIQTKALNIFILF